MLLRFALAFLFFACTASLAQLPPRDTASSPTLKKSVNFVDLFVVVRDCYNRLQPNLRAGDFQVFDNHVPQQIAEFRFVNGPEPRKPDQYPSPGNQARADHRHILIVLPQLSLTSRYYATAALDTAFEKHLLDDSDVAIVDGSSGSYPFESDGKVLERTIKRIKRVTSNPCTGGGSWLPAAVERLAQMRSMSGRKFMVFFTDFETDRECPPGWLLRSGNSPWMLLRESLDANVAIYPIDTRASVPVIPFGGASTQAYFGPEVGTSTSGNVGGTGQSTILAEESESLSEIAAQTGGRALIGNRDFFLAFQSIREDSAYYELGYYLSDLQADGKFHSVTVRLKTPGMAVLTREGYFAPAR